MTDLTTIHHAHHIAQIAALPITEGYSMLTTLISSAVSGAAMFGLGWYIKGRGMTGVQIDLNNVKNDVENLKAKLSAPVPVVTAPAA